MTCIGKPTATSPGGCRQRLVGRSSYCWMKVHQYLGQIFAVAAAFPEPAGKIVPAPVVHDAFQLFYGDLWLPYFKAWKGNFGYYLVPDDGTAPATIVYDANVQWALDYATCGQAYLPSLDDPSCCKLHCACNQCPCSSGWS